MQQLLFKKIIFNQFTDLYNKNKVKVNQLTNKYHGKYY